MNTQEVSVPDRYKQQRYINILAALSSIIPGLGHIYKGYIIQGVCILIVSPFFIWAGLIFGFATFGIGLLVPVVYIGVVAWHAYQIESRRKYHMGIF